MTEQHTLSPMVRVQGLNKVYGRRENLSRALSDVSFHIDAGEYLAIMGPSGSGKTTLLSCLASLERPTSGKIIIDGDEITHMTKKQLAAFRREKMGFIFQDSKLLESLTAFDNIALALTLQGEKPLAIEEKIRNIARELDIEKDLDKFPSHMSGGQRQRVATARAIVTSPRILLADEPTGALDSHAAARTLELLADINTRNNATILMVTHDAYAASFSRRILFIKDGKIFNEIHRGDLSQEDYYTRIMEVQAFLGGGNRVS